MAKIGFIGLGRIGETMAVRLLNAGHAIVGYDFREGVGTGVTEAGGRLAGSLIELSGEAEIIVTLLTDPGAVRATYLGGDGIIALSRPGTLLIDCSTTDVETARAVATEADEAGLLMVDAPATAGSRSAEAEALSVLVGGSDEAVAAAKPILEAVSDSLVHVGPSGSGQAATICTNLVLGVSMIAVSEAGNLADALGLDRQAYMTALSAASMSHAALARRWPEPGHVDGRTNLSGATMLTDLNLVQDAARKTGTATPLSAGAQQLYTLFSAAGLGERDFSQIVAFLRGRDSDAE
ncbi:NAD(P)-dependent oxidoreductase [Amorphus sp. 3PC139-8]|uniref:NAD(P)-dependent oxidoreductase n=1 Tax=Amorphus sp. 3PC139-8 TaxID=2735676 RepID=UPI00345CCEB3